MGRAATVANATSEDLTYLGQEIAYEYLLPGISAFVSGQQGSSDSYRRRHELIMLMSKIGSGHLALVPR